MRPDLDHYLMGLAEQAAARTTCIRRGVGCVLANKRGHVLAISYNGVASGLPHCNQQIKSIHVCHRPPQNMGVALKQLESAGIKNAGISKLEGSAIHYSTLPHVCEGHNLPPGQDNCEAVHAEQNALLQCTDAWTIETAYVTLSPCKACMKLLLGTSCQRIVYKELHVANEHLELWRRAGRIAELLK